MKRTAETCRVLVDRSHSDFDAHGTFWVRHQEPCGAAAHRSGRCVAHHLSHLNLLRARIATAESTIAQARAELAELTEQSVCAPVMKGASCK